MANKRKQPVNHCVAVTLARAARAAAATAFAPLFAHSLAARWYWFLPCLLAAFLWRAGTGLAREWIIRADEVFQHTEQAHRLVFGYGQVPWAFSMGARTWPTGIVADRGCRDAHIGRLYCLTPSRVQFFPVGCRSVIQQQYTARAGYII